MLHVVKGRQKPPESNSLQHRLPPSRHPRRVSPSRPWRRRPRSLPGTVGPGGVLGLQVPLLTPSDNNRIGAVTKLTRFPGHYLYGARRVSPRVVGHLRRTEAGVAEYERLLQARGGLKLVHGMGDALYKAAGRERSVRVYAPVGAHKDLLPYLVRRLLENGANTSFVHSFLDEDVPAERIAADPYTTLSAAPGRHPRPVGRRRALLRGRHEGRRVRHGRAG